MEGAMAARDVVTIGSVGFGPGRPLGWILGPCVIESRDFALRVAGRIRELAESAGIPVIFKSSFDKANRTSGKTFRGPGLHEGLKTLEAVRRETGLPVTTDIHDESQVGPAGEVVDLIQIPAFLARQTDLVQAAGRTGKAVNVKKGQFMAPGDMANLVANLADGGNSRVLLPRRSKT